MYMRSFVRRISHKSEFRRQNIVYVHGIFLLRFRPVPFFTLPNFLCHEITHNIWKDEALHHRNFLLRNKARSWHSSNETRNKEKKL